MKISNIKEGDFSEEEYTRIKTKKAVGGLGASQ